jgi:hypothetical protein
MISDTIQKQIHEAMKAKDELRTTTLKLLSTALHNAEIDKHGKLTSDEEIVLVQREVKKRQDAIVLYRQGGAEEKAKREEAEIVVLKEFLPEEMAREDLIKVIDTAIAKTGAEKVSDMGKIIGMVKAEVGAQAQGSTIAKLVKEKLVAGSM